MSAPRALFAILALAACAPGLPNSAPGAGSGEYSQYLQQRDQGFAPQQPATFSTDAVGAALDASDNGGALGGGATPLDGTQGFGALQAGSAYGAPLDGSAPYGALPQAGYAPTLGQGGLDPNRPRGDAPAGIRQESGEMNRAAGLSDENNFKAVSGRETIESDKERLARNRAQYEVIAPTALPQRSGKTEPNIVQFALNTTHLPGTRMYKRSSLFGGSSACNRYASPDLAQEAFLASGGPQKDAKGLDPDGDGFACGWDPRPFRTALR